MADDDTPLSAALADVRRAWRLVYAYQRRVNDLLALVDTELVAHHYEFKQWRPSQFSPPPRTGTPFFRADTWAWDMLPGYRLYAEWSRWDAAKGLTRRVTAEVSADSGFRKGVGEPDPSTFVDAAEAESVLWLGLFTASTKSPDWQGAWNALSVLPYKPGEERSAEIGGVACTLRSLPVYLDDLPEPGAVRELVIQRILAWSAGDVP